MLSPSGVYGAAVTPRRLGSQDVNLGVMWDLIDFLVDRKVDGIVLMGCTGEFVHYSNSERMRLMGLAPRRSKVPVLINVSHTTLDGAIELGQAAGASGAAGVLLMAPFFFRYNDDAVRTFILRFAEECDLNIPVLLYNIPQFGNPVSPSLAAELIRSGAVQGIKDSSGDWDYLSALIELRREHPFTLMVGNDSVFSRARPQGISGVISGVACALPELLVALDRAHAASDTGRIPGLESRLREFIEWINRMPVPVGIREAAMVRGLRFGPNAVPSSPEQERIIREFREWLSGWLKQVLSECGNA